MTHNNLFLNRLVVYTEENANNNDLTPAQISEINRLKDSIDILDSNAIITYGAQPQRKSWLCLCQGR